MKDIVREYLEKHIELAQQLLDDDLISKLADIAGKVSEAVRSGGKLVLFGNGGSAADAQHIATELVGKFLRERDAMPALALNTNNSIISAIANDYSYDRVFARQVEALVNDKDVVIGLSTSGNSDSVIEGVRAAKQKGALTAGFTGRSGGKLKDAVDICLAVPSDETPHIQEMHITLGHILCLLIEDGVSGQEEVSAPEQVKKPLPIKLIALDIDGVLTDGTVSIAGGEESKKLFYRDMDAINNGKRQGLAFALITGESTPIVDSISRRLEIGIVLKSAKDKAGAVTRLSTDLKIPLEQICYIGDSRRDAPAMSIVGLGLAPADADEEARKAASVLLRNRGGEGAVAEAVYLVIELNAKSGESAGS